MTTKVDTELGHKSYKKTQMKSAHWFVTDHENVQNLHILCSFENVLKTLKKKKVIKMNSCFVILCLLFFFSWILTPTTKSLCVLMCDILWISTKMTNLWYRNLFSFRWLIEALNIYIYIYTCENMQNIYVKKIICLTNDSSLAEDIMDCQQSRFELHKNRYLRWYYLIIDLIIHVNQFYIHNVAPEYMSFALVDQ